MNSTNERAMRRLATATTLSRELTANAWDVAVMEARVRVKRKMKNLEASTVKPEKQNRHYSMEFYSIQGDINLYILMHFPWDCGQYHNLIKIQPPHRQLVAGSAFSIPLYRDSCIFFFFFFTYQPWSMLWHSRYTQGGFSLEWDQLELWPGKRLTHDSSHSHSHDCKWRKWRENRTAIVE